MKVQAQLTYSHGYFVKFTHTHTHTHTHTTLVTGCNEVVAKVMFLLVSVILSTGGGLPQCMLGCYPPQDGGTPQEGDPLPRRPPTMREAPPRGRHTLPRRSLGSRPPQAHTLGGNWGGSDPGPHPRGKLRGIRSSPPRSRLWHTVNERPVRILLKCILVCLCHSVVELKITFPH